MRRFFSGFLVSASLLLFVVGTAHAQLNTTGNGNPFAKFYTNTFGQVYNITQNDSTTLQKTLPSAIGQVIAIMLSFIGVILLVLMVYSGFLWLTAGGNDEQVAKAKKNIYNAVIGMAIALSAFVLTNFIVNQLNNVLTAGANGTSGTGTGTGTQGTTIGGSGG